MGRATMRTVAICVGAIGSPAVAAGGFASGQWQQETKLLTLTFPAFRSGSSS